jgi:hypothetical protein
MYHYLLPPSPSPPPPPLYTTHDASIYLKHLSISAPQPQVFRGFRRVPTQGMQMGHTEVAMAFIAREQM